MLVVRLVHWFVWFSSLGSIHLNDSDKITFGDSNELEIFHNGNNNSIIQENGGRTRYCGSKFISSIVTNENFSKEL